MLSSGSNARYYVPRSVFVAVVAALASCTDAATLMLKMKGELYRILFSFSLNILPLNAQYRYLPYAYSSVLELHKL